MRLNIETASYRRRTPAALSRRLSDFVLKTADLEKAGNTQAADLRWMGFDRLIDRITNGNRAHVTPQTLYDSASELAENLDPYIVHAGLALMSTPKVSDYLTLDSLKFNKALQLYSGYMPTPYQVAVLGERSTEYYNFLRSTEGILQLGQAAIRADEKDYLQSSVRVLTENMSDEHKAALVKAGRAEDMKGTMIAKFARVWQESSYKFQNFR